MHNLNTHPDFSHIPHLHPPALILVTNLPYQLTHYPVFCKDDPNTHPKFHYRVRYPDPQFWNGIF